MRRVGQIQSDVHARTDAEFLEALGGAVREVAQLTIRRARPHELDRRTVRATFDRRWTARRMAEDYVRLYESLVRPARRLHAVNG